MQINSDINILGSLGDWDLVGWLALQEDGHLIDKKQKHQFTSIKTTKSLTTTLKVLKDNLLTSSVKDCQNIVTSALKMKGIGKDTLILLFWNASANNELLYYLNEKVFFPALYSGRLSIKNDEVVACIRDLRQTEDHLKKWSDITVKTTASKYLTLLKKFGLMEGSVNKSISLPYLSDDMFVLFAYWIAATSDKPNLVESPWLPYCFCEKQVFMDRLLQKKFSKYFNVVYTGDRLNIEPIIPYESIYEYISKS
jgi:hypothetical protein